MAEEKAWPKVRSLICGRAPPLRRWGHLLDAGPSLEHPRPRTGSLSEASAPWAAPAEQPSGPAFGVAIPARTLLSEPHAPCPPHRGAPGTPGPARSPWSHQGLREASVWARCGLLRPRGRTGPSRPGARPVSSAHRRDTAPATWGRGGSWGGESATAPAPLPQRVDGLQPPQCLAANARTAFSSTIRVSIGFADPSRSGTAGSDWLEGGGAGTAAMAAGRAERERCRGRHFVCEGPGRAHSRRGAGRGSVPRVERGGPRWPSWRGGAAAPPAAPPSALRDRSSALPAPSRSCAASPGSEPVERRSPDRPGELRLHLRYWAGSGAVFLSK